MLLMNLEPRFPTFILQPSTFLAIFLLLFSPFRGARNGAPTPSASNKVKYSSTEFEPMELFVVCASNAHDLWPFSFFFFNDAAARRIYYSTTNKLHPRNRFELLQGL